MPDMNSILLTLNLKEPNIRFDENYVFQEKIKGVESLVFSGTQVVTNLCVCGGSTPNSVEGFIHTR